MEEEVILNKIIEEAQNEANSIISEAKEKAKKIEEESKNKIIKETEEQFEIIKEKINKKMVSELEKADFEAKSSILIEKKKIMKIVKEKVKQKICDLPNEDYIEIIDEKLKKYINEKDVEILLPRKCYDEIKKIAIGYGMKVLNVTDEFESGVIIKCGNIDYNYDFEENIKLMNDEIEKEITAILF